MSKNLYKQAMNHLKIPANINEKTITFLQKTQSTNVVSMANEGAVKHRHAWKKQLIIISAIFVCLAMVVSAAVIINMRYVPLVGFTDKDYAVYAIPETIELGNGIVIETIMRTQNAETGKNDFMMIITARTYGERDNPPDFQELEELKVTTADKTEYILKSGGSSLSSSPLVEGELDGIYVYETTFNFSPDDFPAINEFTISTVSGKYLTEVTLIEDAFQGLYGYVEENGVSILVRQVAKNSRVIVYKADDKNFDLDYIFGEDHPFFTRTSSAGIILYDENGNNLGTSAERGGRQFYYDWISLLDERPEKISKAEVRGIIFEVRDKLGLRQIYADIDIPVPDDGEKIEYAEPLAIYKQNGITVMINSIERDGDDLIITNYQYDTYEGTNADRLLAFEAIFINSDNFRRSILGGGPNAWFEEGEYERKTTIKLTEENIKNKSVRLALSGFNFVTLYDWEIYLGE